MSRPSRQGQRLPFLHRNWTTGITASQTWGARKIRAAPKGWAEPPYGPEDDLYARPSKRRRVGEASDNITHTAKAPECLALCLPDYPSVRTNGLRVQVFNLFHQDTPRFRFTNSIANLPQSEIATFSARCKITIMSEKCGMPLLLHCDAQVGTVQAHVSANGSHSLAWFLFEPFAIPLDKIAVLNENSRLFGLADKYKLRIEVESTGSDAWPPLDLLALTGHAIAPGNQHPIQQNGLRVKQANVDDCILFAESSDFFGRNRMRIPLWLRASPQHDSVCTNFVMDMDVRWSTGFLWHSSKPLEKGVLPTIVAMHPDELPQRPSLAAMDHEFLDGSCDYFSRTCGKSWDVSVSKMEQMSAASDRQGRDYAKGHRQRHIDKESTNHIIGHTTESSANDIHHGADDEEDEAAEGYALHNRSLRARKGQPDYNIRNITNKAHKQNARTPRKKPAISFDKGDYSAHSPNAARKFGIFSDAGGGYRNNGNGDDYDYDHIFDADPAKMVTYIVPPDKFSVNGFVCCFCMASNPNMNQLRAHFLSHIHYRFECNKANSGRTGYAVKVSHCPDETEIRLQPKVFQLGRPTKPLDLDKLLAGDDSWITSRYGPQHDCEVFPSALIKPRPKPKSRLAQQSKAAELVVPQTKQPLYDPLSKALLEHGTAIRPTVVDDSWLIHKHREVVQDYSDLSGSEKEFIQEWDKFITAKRIFSDAYIPQAMLEFVKEKGSWLAGDQRRANEFGRHMMVMDARGILPDADFKRIVQEISKARRRHLTEHPKPIPAAKATRVHSLHEGSLHRSKTGCAVCGLPVQGPTTLMCCNKECSRSLYHSTCAAEKANVSIKEAKWYCNACSHLKRTGA